MEIPGYTEIALHVVDFEDVESQLLKTKEEDIVDKNSVILTRGVNTELLKEFLKIKNIERRVNFCYNLNLMTLLKLIIRKEKLIRIKIYYIN